MNLTSLTKKNNETEEKYEKSEAGDETNGGGERGERVAQR